MITPEEKDAILIKLIELCSTIAVPPNPKWFNLSESRFDSILRQFIRLGFVRVIPATHKDERTGIMTEIEAEDFIRRGGFKFEEDAFRNKFTKLELELAKLEGEIPQEKFSNIMTLVSAASAAVSAYTGLNP